MHKEVAPSALFKTVPVPFGNLQGFPKLRCCGMLKITEAWACVWPLFNHSLQLRSEWEFLRWKWLRSLFQWSVVIMSGQPISTTLSTGVWRTGAEMTPYVLSGNKFRHIKKYKEQYKYWGVAFWVINISWIYCPSLCLESYLPLGFYFNPKFGTPDSTE